MLQLYSIACIAAEVEELPAASGDFEDEASSGQTGPRGRERLTQACMQAELLISPLRVTASVIVCISSPSPSELCKAIRFDLQDSSLKQTHRHRTYEVLHQLFFSLTGRQ